MAVLQCPALQVHGTHRLVLFNILMVCAYLASLELTDKIADTVLQGAPISQCCAIQCRCLSWCLFTLCPYCACLLAMILVYYGPSASRQLKKRLCDQEVAAALRAALSTAVCSTPVRTSMASSS